MTEPTDFVRAILALEPAETAGYSEYGGRVMPVLELYASLATDSERQNFRGALEEMLSDQRKRVRGFAVAISLGFIILYDAI